MEAARRAPQLRAAILERYDELAAEPRRDRGAALRVELLAALRPLVTVGDRERLEAAVTTYEYGPLVTRGQLAPVYLFALSAH